MSNDSAHLVADPVEPVTRAPSRGSPDHDATPGLHIPEARDGFFGYNEERSLQHIDEISLAHRRSSVSVSSDGAKPSISISPSSFTVAGQRPSAPPSPLQLTSSRLPIIREPQLADDGAGEIAPLLLEEPDAA